jgi:hypothetical protein
MEARTKGVTGNGNASRVWKGELRTAFFISCGIIEEILVASKIFPLMGKLRRFTEWENYDKRYFFLLPFLWL